MIPRQPIEQIDRQTGCELGGEQKILIGTRGNDLAQQRQRYLRTGAVVVRGRSVRTEASREVLRPPERGDDFCLGSQDFG